MEKQEQFHQELSTREQEECWEDYCQDSSIEADWSGELPRAPHLGSGAQANGASAPLACSRVGAGSWEVTRCGSGLWERYPGAPPALKRETGTADHRNRNFGLSRSGPCNVEAGKRLLRQNSGPTLRFTG